MAASGTMGSPRTGMKKEIEDIFQKLQEHDDALARVDATIEKNAVSQHDCDNNLLTRRRVRQSSLGIRGTRFIWQSYVWRAYRWHGLQSVIVERKFSDDMAFAADAWRR